MRVEVEGGAFLFFSFCGGYLQGEREGGGSRRPTVPIIDILGLGKHGPLKPSQKHTHTLKGRTSHRSAGDVCRGVCTQHFLCTCAQVCVLNYPVEK